VPGTGTGTPLGEQGGAPDQIATQVFVDHRELLFSVVYSMLGSVADTEDVLQETWLAWASRNAASSAELITSPRAYLVRVAVHGALARQQAISRRREDYVGPWLPEPLATGGPVGDGAEIVMRAQSVSLALMVVLETLTPLERAVFVLHEVFGYEHAEVASILDRSPSAIRQLAHRAREHVRARRPRYPVDPKVHQRVTEQFVAAVKGRELSGLIRVLAPEVILWTDGGGRARAARRPVRGRDKVARLIVGGALRWPIADLEIRYRQVNGEPAAVLMSRGTPYLLVVLDLVPGGDQARGVYVITSPGKLSRLGEGGR
jgi:RNA polymerase sigma factor (sigma-70 family)